jgi:hypothetical protein
MSDKNSLKQENYLHKIQGKPIPDAPPTWKDDMTPVKTIAPTKKKKRKGTNTKTKTHYKAAENSHSKQKVGNYGN